MNEAAAHTVLPGRRLQAAREKLGWSETEVARRLHMSVNFVRAIEADDYERLPEATFIKGYMRNYARLLDIPADEVANLFEQLVDDEDDRETPAEQPDDSNKRPWGLVIAALLLAAALLAWLLWPEPGAEPVAQATQSTVVGMQQPQLAAPADDAADVSVEGAAGPAGVAQDSVAEDTDAAAVAVADTLAIAFNGPCWVQVLDADGETLYSGQRDVGGQLALSGKAPFRITFGNGAAVSSLAVNGESVTLPQSTPGNVVRVRAP